MNFDEWLKLGQGVGWISEVMCYTHDGVATDAENDLLDDEGELPCISVIRLLNFNG